MRGADHFQRTRGRDLRKDPTSAEAALWGKLRGRRLSGWKFVRQEPVGPYFADFACRGARLVVEVDGATHSTDEELAYDARREAYLCEEGYRVLRFPNDEVFHNIDAVCDTIFHALQESPSPLPVKRGEGVCAPVPCPRATRRGLG
jgi:very-short-patch-repair endonuclease